MKFFFAYLCGHKKSVAASCVCLAVFITVFRLSGVEVDTVLYAFALCAFATAVFVFFDFISFCKKHAALKKTVEDIMIADSLPEPGTQLEKDYREIILTLKEYEREFVSETDKKSSERLDYFTLWVHQIKTPIAAMRLLLQTGADSGDIEDELFKIEHYVDMVLSYLRLGGTNDFVLKRYNLDEIVKASVKKFSKVFIREKISLELQEMNRSVLTDRKWLEFVLQQIISNALKYTNKGKISVYICGDCLCVEDTGMGIAPEDLPRVCEKGFTGYNGRTENKSTGLGLYLCAQVLKRLGHGLKIESEPGRGTTVKIDLSQIEMKLE